jgi:hypothetical protein
MIDQQVAASALGFFSDPQKLAAHRIERSEGRGNLTENCHLLPSAATFDGGANRAIEPPATGISSETR